MIRWATGLARGAVRRYSRAADLRWRRLPHLAVGRRSGDRPTVYYLAPVPSGIFGGIRNLYRHVDNLNAVGISAAVVHPRTGYRASWFANDTRVLGASEVVLTPDDLLVVPECYGPGLGAVPDGVRVVVFNQGAYITFDHVPFDTTRAGAPYADVPGLVGLLAVSRDNAELLRYTFPDLPVGIARPVIDPELFHPSGEPPARRLAYLTHRRPEEREQLRHTLRARGLLERWAEAPIVGRSESETAAIMRGSAIFLSFSHREGFGLPPAEAMASGCFVVGYAGLGGREYFEPPECAPVPDGDLLAFARAVEAACAAYDDDPETFRKAGLAASERIRARYSVEALRAELLDFYTPLLGAAR
ncbi:glycosyltransferase [Micromonospora globbae]|uniref:glycosyltransferase n=1 Tax=Micromonospora globbae TaxID=1894969 RepID=UPI003867D7CA|nr:glycosyltransferase [Micromonospora globbae]